MSRGLKKDYNIKEEVRIMTYKNLELPKLIKVWDKLPRFVRVTIWIGISSALMAALSYLLEQPEMIKYSPILNILLVALKEGNDFRKAKNEK